MLKIIYNLHPFFEDCYRRINVREYAKLLKISPPTASKLLTNYHKEGLIGMRKERNYIFFFANKESKLFIDLSRIYWQNKLSELVSFLKKELVLPTIILFGSVAKAEVTKDSDIDIAVISRKKELGLKLFEKKLKRKIQVFLFQSLKDIKNKELANNILNGCVLFGRIKI